MLFRYCWQNVLVCGLKDLVMACDGLSVSTCMWFVIVCVLACVFLGGFPQQIKYFVSLDVFFQGFSLSHAVGFTLVLSGRVSLRGLFVNLYVNYRLLYADFRQKSALDKIIFYKLFLLKISTAFSSYCSSQKLKIFACLKVCKKTK